MGTSRKKASRRWFRTSRDILGAVFLALTVGLILTDPMIATSRLGGGCPDGKQKTCPDECSGHGQCVGGVCVCSEGYTGVGCQYESCPGNCTGRGECVDGFCICKPQFGGPGCTVDRLDALAQTLLQNVDFELKFKEDHCIFLTKKDVERYGGDHIVYWSDVTNSMETYSIPEEMKEVLPEICPDYTYSTCAVVGNSGILRYAEYGSEIDAHDMVYRFNQAPTMEFEKHVGSKTNFESLNAKFAHQLMREEPGWRWRDPLAVYVMFEPLKLKDTYAAIRAHFPAVDTLLFSPEFFVQAHQIYDNLQANLEMHEFGCFTGEKPMSGFYAVLFAQYICQTVDLFGFDSWQDSMNGKFKMRYHYFDQEEPRPGAHSFDATYYMYLLMDMKTDGQRVKVKRVQMPAEEEIPRLAKRGKGGRVEPEEEELEEELKDEEAAEGGGDGVGAEGGVLQGGGGGGAKDPDLWEGEKK